MESLNTPIWGESQFNDEFKLEEIQIEKIPIDGMSDDDEKETIVQPEKEREISMSKSRERWIIFSELLTFYIPDCFLKKLLIKNNQNEDKINEKIIGAWREKTTLFILFIFINCLFFFVVTIIQPLLCTPLTDVYTHDEINKNTNTQIMILYGKVINVGEYEKVHPGSSIMFKQYIGQDVGFLFNSPSPFFKKPQELNIDTDKLSLFQEYKKNDTSKYCSINYCHPFPYFLFNSSLNSDVKKYTMGDLYLTRWELNDNRDLNWIILYNRVYNVSEYVLYGHSIYPKTNQFQTEDKIQRKDVAYYLDERLNDTILFRISNDATDLFEKKFHNSIDRKNVIDYLDAQYFIGTIDTREDNICKSFDILYWIVLGLVIFFLLIKFFVAIFILRKNYSKKKSKYIITFVPCYTEDKKSIEKTIYSIIDSDYPNKKKFIFVVVDGVIKGKNNDDTTSEYVLNIFNRSLTENDSKSFTYRCVHETETFNRARVFSGFVDLSIRENSKLNNTEESRIPYIIVVKTGLLNEQQNSRKGNRGKRDSQLILLNFLSSVNYQNITSELDDVLYDHCLNKLNITINRYDFLLTVDADTEVHTHSISQMVNRMKNDSKIYGVCGETLISNKMDSWVTGIQVYEYYFNHNLNKAFESLFNSVACLPGCFSMYRIRSDYRRKPIIIDRDLIYEYSDSNINTLHKRNLFTGEDRLFTTLLTKHFRKGKLKYIVEAKCSTVVPNTWSVFLSQRRRWINSTLHNLFYLLWIDLRGMCCISMKTMVVIDLISTIILPSSFLLLLYIFYGLIFGNNPNVSFLIMSGAILTIHVLIIIIRRDFVYLFWLPVYILAMGVFSFILPIYAIAKSDDGSWGATRKVEKRIDRAPMIELMK